MKIALPAKEKDLRSEINEEFGRCPYFLVINTEKMDAKYFKNEYNQENQGAGISAAQFLGNQNIDAIVVKNIGPKAFDTVTTGGIDVYQYSGTLGEGISNFKSNNLVEMNSPSRRSKGKRKGGGEF